MNSLDDEYIKMFQFQDWDIRVKKEMTKADQEVVAEQIRKTILRDCSYMDIISTPHLKAAMGW